MSLNKYCSINSSLYGTILYALNSHYVAHFAAEHHTMPGLWAPDHG